LKIELKINRLFLIQFLSRRAAKGHQTLFKNIPFSDFAAENKKMQGAASPTC